MDGWTLRDWGFVLFASAVKVALTVGGTGPVWERTRQRVPSGCLSVDVRGGVDGDGGNGADWTLLWAYPGWQEFLPEN